MRDQRYGPPSLPLAIPCSACFGSKGSWGSVAQDQWYDCEACGGTGLEKFDVQRALRDKLDKDCEADQTKVDRQIFARLEAQSPSEDTPRRWRKVLPFGMKHPVVKDSQYIHGCYFPRTDLCIDDCGKRSTGKPEDSGLCGVEWLDG